MSDPEMTTFGMHPEEAIYDPSWCIEYCKAYAEQLRDKTRANRAVHAAECIEYLLSLVQKEWVGLTDEEMEEAMKYWSDPCRSAYGGAEAADDEYVDMIGTWRYIEAKLKDKNT